MTARESRSAKHTRRDVRVRDLPRGEWERLLRERAFLRPLPPPLPLHVMARQRAQELPEPPGPAGEGQGDDTAQAPRTATSGR